MYTGFFHTTKPWKKSIKTIGEINEIN